MHVIDTYDSRNLPTMTDVATLLNDFLCFCLGFGATLVKVDDSQPLTSVSWTSSSSSIVDLHVNQYCTIHTKHV